MKFEGFSPLAFQFLEELQANNNKEWFEERRSEYEELILTPLRRIVFDLGPLMYSIDPLIEIQPAVNKTISRIYRDTRFSKDQRVFRDHMWITFKHPRADWNDRPSWWFEIMPSGFTFGMGFYQASPKTTLAFRQKIDRNVDEFKKVIAFFPGKPKFRLRGDMYKKTFNYFLPQEIQTWYQRRNMYVICKRPIEDILFSPGLVDYISKGFEQLIPLYHYWLEVSPD